MVVPVWLWKLSPSIESFSSSLMVSVEAGVEQAPVEWAPGEPLALNRCCSAAACKAAASKATEVPG